PPVLVEERERRGRRDLEAPFAVLPHLPHRGGAGERTGDEDLLRRGFARRGETERHHEPRDDSPHRRLHRLPASRIARDVRHLALPAFAQIPFCRFHLGNRYSQLKGKKMLTPSWA